MKLSIYVCTIILAVSILSIGVFDRYEIRSMDVPMQRDGYIKVLVRLDKLTGATCLVAGSDGHNYYSTVWTLKINRVSDEKRLFTQVLPVSCN